MICQARELSSTANNAHQLHEHCLDANDHVQAPWPARLPHSYQQVLCLLLHKSVKATDSAWVAIFYQCCLRARRAGGRVFGALPGSEHLLPDKEKRVSLLRQQICVHLST